MRSWVNYVSSNSISPSPEYISLALVIYSFTTKFYLFTLLYLFIFHRYYFYSKSFLYFFLFPVFSCSQQSNSIRIIFYLGNYVIFYLYQLPYFVRLLRQFKKLYFVLFSCLYYLSTCSKIAIFNCTRSEQFQLFVYFNQLVQKLLFCIIIFILIIIL